MEKNALITERALAQAVKASALSRTLHFLTSKYSQILDLKTKPRRLYLYLFDTIRRIRQITFIGLFLP